MAQNQIDEIMTSYNIDLGTINNTYLTLLASQNSKDTQATLSQVMERFNERYDNVEYVLARKQFVASFLNVSVVLALIGHIVFITYHG